MAEERKFGPHRSALWSVLVLPCGRALLHALYRRRFVSTGLGRNGIQTDVSTDRSHNVCLPTQLVSKPRLNNNLSFYDSDILRQTVRGRTVCVICQNSNNN